MPKSKDRRARRDRPDTPRAAEDLEGLSLDVLTTAALPDGIFILDGDLRIVFAGPAFWALFGHRRSRARGQDLLTFFAERDRQTVRRHLAEVRDARSEPLLSVGYRAAGSEMEVEVRATVLDLQGKQFFIGAVRDMTERQRQARQAAMLTQAAACLAASDSVDAVLEAISESALAGTRALYAWVTLDARKQVERELATAGIADALKSLPWQTAAFSRLLYRGTSVGLLTAIYREGTCRTRRRRPSWRHWRPTRRRPRQTPVCWRPPARRSRWKSGSAWRGSCTTRYLSRSPRFSWEHRWHVSGSTVIRPGPPSRSTTSCASRRRARPRCGP